MQMITTGARFSAIAVGLVILATIAFATVDSQGATGANAASIYAMAAGIGAASVVFGLAIAEGRKALAVFVLLSALAGEGFNVTATADRQIDAAEDRQAQIKDLASARMTAERHLAEVRAAPVASLALNAAEKALKAADDAVISEARQGGCKTACNGLKGIAAPKQQAFDAALRDAENAKAEAIAKAEAALLAIPPPRSATPTADRIGVPGWVYDLVKATLKSLGLNGMAAALIAFGANGLPLSKPKVEALAADQDGQTDFPPLQEESAEIIRGYFGPDKPNGGPGGGVRLSKAQAFDDLMARLSRGETIPSQDTLVEEWGRPKQTVSDWLKGWRDVGVIPAARQTGRCKAIVAA